MAGRFYHNFTSHAGRQFRVFIFDRDYTGTGIEFDQGGKVTIQWGNGAGDIVEQVIGSRLTFELIIREADTDFQDLMNDIATSELGRFSMNVYEDKGSGYEMYWAGQVLPELITQPDTYPSVVKLTATDGLGALKEVLYQDGTQVYRGYETFVEMVARAIHKTGLVDEFFGNGATDYVLRTAVEWYHGRMPGVSQVNDPLNLSRINHATWYEKVDEGEVPFNPTAEIETYNTNEVLEQIALGWLSRLFQSNGRFWFRQLAQDGVQTILYRDYAIGANEGVTGNTSGSIAIRESINQNADRKRLYLGEERHDPGLKKSTVVYNHGSSRDVLGFKPPLLLNTPISWPKGAWALPGSGGLAQEVTMKIAWKIKTKLTNNSEVNHPGFGVDWASPNALTLLYEIKISDGPNTFWLDRDVNGNANWRSIAKTVKVNPSISSCEATAPAGVGIATFAVEIDVPPIPQQNNRYDQNTFRLSSRLVNQPYTTSYGFNVVVVGASLFDNDYRGTSDDYVLQYREEAIRISVFTDGNDSIDERRFTAGNQTTADIQKDQDLGEILFGGFQGGYNPGAVEVSDGSTFEVGDNLWGVGTVSGSDAMTQLLVNEVMNLKNSYKRIYQGTIKSSKLDFHKTILLGGKVFTPIAATYDLERDEWSGQWYEVERSDVLTQPEPPANGVLRLGQNYAATIGDINRRIETTFRGLNELAHTSNVIEQGSTITSIKVFPLTNDVLKTGDTITIYDRDTGNSQRLTVGANTTIGDTSIQISGSPGAEFRYAPGSQFMKSIGDSVGGGGINGSGTANYLPIWTNSDTIGNSSVYIDGTGQITFENYGTGAYTGAVARHLAVTASGEIVEDNDVATKTWANAQFLPLSTVLPQNKPLVAGQFFTSYDSTTGAFGTGAETDPIFSASSAATITSQNITDWNTAFGWGNHATAGYELQANKGVANGYAPLDGSTKIPNAYLPSLAITETFVVNSQAEMLALSQAQQGDVAVRTDLNKTFILLNNSPGTLASWQELLTPTDAVQSVNSLTGAVQLDLAFASGLLSITGGNSINLDSRYYTEAEVDALISATDLQAVTDNGATTTNNIVVNGLTATTNLIDAQGDFRAQSNLRFDAYGPASGHNLLIVGTDGTVFTRDENYYTTEAWVTSQGYQNASQVSTIISNTVNKAYVDVLGINAAELGGIASSGYALKVHTHVTADITDLASYTGFDARYYTETEIDQLLLAFIDGSGTANYIPRWTNSDSLGDSVMVQSGAGIVIGDTSTTYTFDVNGVANFRGNAYVAGALAVGLTSTTFQGEFYAASSNSEVSITSNTDSAFLFLVSNVDGLGGAESGLIFKDGASDLWELGKAEIGAFRLIDSTLGAEVFGFDAGSGGQLSLPLYGAGTFAGTVRYFLAVDANGDVIESNDVATQTWVQSQNYLTDADLSGYATETWVNSQGFLKSADLTGYATETWVQNQGYLTANQTITLGGDLTGTGTTTIDAFIGANKVGIAQLNVTDGANGQVLTTDGNGVLSFTDKTDLTGYATETWVNAQGFLKAADLAGYATEAWVLAKNYIDGTGQITFSDYGQGSYTGAETYFLAVTSTGVIVENNDVATQTWVTLQDYLTDADLSGYATETWVQSQNYLVAADLTGYATEAWVSGQGYLTGNQTITLAGDVTGSGATTIATSIAANVVGITELDVTDGTNGQVLTTDGNGALSFTTISTATPTLNQVTTAGNTTSNWIQTGTVRSNQLRNTGTSNVRIDLTTSSLQLISGGQQKMVITSTGITMQNGSLDLTNLTGVSDNNDFLRTDTSGKIVNGSWSAVNLSQLNNDMGFITGISMGPGIDVVGTTISLDIGNLLPQNRIDPNDLIAVFLPLNQTHHAIAFNEIPLSVFMRTPGDLPGVAYLADTQTFTGINTFGDDVIFNDIVQMESVLFMNGSLNAIDWGDYDLLNGDEFRYTGAGLAGLWTFTSQTDGDDIKLRLETGKGANSLQMWIDQSLAREYITASNSLYISSGSNDILSLSAANSGGFFGITMGGAFNITFSTSGLGRANMNDDGLEFATDKGVRFGPSQDVMIGYKDTTTWTPVFSGLGSGTTSNTKATYGFIGNMCYVNAYTQYSGLTGTDTIEITSPVTADLRTINYSVMYGTAEIKGVVYSIVLSGGSISGNEITVKWKMINQNGVALTPADIPANWNMRLMLCYPRFVKN